MDLASQKSEPYLILLKINIHRSLFFTGLFCVSE